jgi:hypothetical protein
VDSHALPRSEAPVGNEARPRSGRVRLEFARVPAAEGPHHGYRAQLRARRAQEADLSSGRGVGRARLGRDHDEAGRPHGLGGMPRGVLRQTGVRRRARVDGGDGAHRRLVARGRAARRVGQPHTQYGQEATRQQQREATTQKEGNASTMYTHAVREHRPVRRGTRCADGEGGPWTRPRRRASYPCAGENRSTIPAGGLWLLACGLLVVTPSTPQSRAPVRPAPTPDLPPWLAGRSLYLGLDR